MHVSARSHYLSQRDRIVASLPQYASLIKPDGLLHEIDASVPLGAQEDRRYITEEVMPAYLAIVDETFGSFRKQSV